MNELRIWVVIEFGKVYIRLRNVRRVCTVLHLGYVVLLAPTMLLSGEIWG